MYDLQVGPRDVVSALGRQKDRVSTESGCVCWMTIKVYRAVSRDDTHTHTHRTTAQGRQGACRTISPWMCACNNRCRFFFRLTRRRRTVTFRPMWWCPSSRCPTRYTRAPTPCRSGLAFLRVVLCVCAYENIIRGAASYGGSSLCVLDIFSLKLEDEKEISQPYMRCSVVFLSWR